MNSSKKIYNILLEIDPYNSFSKNTLIDMDNINIKNNLKNNSCQEQIINLDFEVHIKKNCLNSIVCLYNVFDRDILNNNNIYVINLMNVGQNE